MSKVAKTAGRRIDHQSKTETCAKGHEIFRAVIMPVVGSRKKIWACLCTVTWPIRDERDSKKQQSS